MRYKYETTDASTYKLLLENARFNRNHPTQAESVLWKCLAKDNIGAHFRRQHPIYGYIADFICIRKRLIVEVDGGYHNEEEQKKHDEEREYYLRSIGFNIMRFSNEEVIGDTGNVLKKIKNYIENYTEDPSSETKNQDKHETK